MRERKVGETSIFFLPFFSLQISCFVANDSVFGFSQQSGAMYMTVMQHDLMTLFLFLSVLLVRAQTKFTHLLFTMGSGS